MSIVLRPFVADRNHQSFLDSHLLMKENFTDDTATSVEFLDWLYLKNPYKKAMGIIAYDGDKPVSQLFLSFQECSYKGSKKTVAIASNACTSPAYRNQGLFAKIFARLIEEAKTQDIPFIWAYPNPSSLKGFLKSGFHIVQEKSLELTPISYFGMLSEAIKKEKFSVLTNTEEPAVPLHDLKYFTIKKSDQISNKPVNHSELEPSWKVPLTKVQMRWRYELVPARKYFMLEQQSTGHIIILRFVKLFGIKTGLIMKTTATNNSEYNHLLKELSNDLKGKISFLTTLPSNSTGPKFSNIFHHRFLVPHQLSPRKFPLAVFPLQNEKILGDDFDFVLGDYEAL